MGRPEDLPEVVPPPPAPLPEYDAGLQVVSDHDGSAHQVRLDESQRDKYPAAYGNEPKLPLDPSQSPVSTDSTYQQQWLDQQQHQNWLLAPGIGHPVSALSPADTSAPWSSIDPGAGFGGDSRFGDEEARSSDVLQPPRPPEEKNICGIPRRTFILMVIFSLIVIAAAVGGGVGGALKARQEQENRDAAAQQPGDAGNNSPTQASGSTTATTTSPKPKPTYTSLFDETTIEDGFAFQGYSGVNGTGNRTQIYTEEGFFDFGFKIRSYMWQPGKTDCCITFCMADNATGKETGRQDVGWRCDPRKRIETPEAFPKLNIWCGRWLNTKQQQICQKPKMIERGSEVEGERTWFSLPLF